MTECETVNRPVLKGIHEDGKTVYLYQPRCKQWSCEPCARTNRLLWQAKIGYGYEFYTALGKKDWSFVTITAHKKCETAEQCLYVFPKAWAKLSTRMRRQYKGIRYVILPEHHANGRVHWHMIASSGIKERWVKDNCAATGLGYMGTSAIVEDSIRAIMYVSKYIGKSLDDQEWPENLRRIRTSQKWPTLPHNDGYEELPVTWMYMHTYPNEGLPYLAYELELSTGKNVIVMGS